MLIYITNRKLPKLKVGKKTKVSVAQISQKLNRSKPAGHERISTGLASKDYKSITFYPHGDEVDLFQAIDSSEYKKPWLVFVHGFHQDPAETIEKARLLEQVHGVNVVLFAWPSRPNPVESFNTDSILKQLKSYALTMVLGVARPSLLGFFLGELKNLVADYKNNYAPARKNAEQSTQDFYAALEVVRDNLLPAVKPSNLSLVVHSMGNYLLQKTIYDKNKLPLTFWNIVSHQADVKATNHASWVSSLFGYCDNKLYVTVNVLDVVLASSNVLHRLNKVKDSERLGQSVQLKPDGLYQGYIQNIASYLDFTDGVGIETEHEIFTRNSEEIDEYIVSLLGRIFRGEADRLPVIKGRSKSGFSMMPTLPRVFKPRFIKEDESLCSGGFDDDCLIESLKEFEDPFAKEPDYIPELDDDY